MTDYDSDEIDIIDDDAVLDDGVEVYDDDEFAEKGRFGRMFDVVKSWFTTPPARPGSQDIARSPFVQWMVGGCITLFLLFGIFWFMILRETAQRQFDAALALTEEGKYAQSITAFEKFISVYPKHNLTNPAYLAKGRASVLKEVETASPNWVQGTESLKTFIKDNRDKDGFKDERDNIFEWGKKIALGAAKTAAAKTSDEILEASVQGNTMMSRYAPEDGVSDELKTEIRELQLTAKAAILRKNVFEKGVSEIQELVNKNRVQPALDRREALIQREPAYEKEPEVRKLLADILEAERTTVKETTLDRDAGTDDWLPELPRPVSITTNTRAETTEPVGTERCFAIGGDCLYSVDTVTGEPIWRRVIGSDSPFFPLQVSTGSGSILAFDTYRNSLIRLERETGALIWEQPIENPIAGAPLVHENQIFLGTLGKELLRINLESGRLTSRLKFSQPLLSPPSLTPNGSNLIVAGDKGLVYSVSTLPLQIKNVSYLGQSASSVKTSLIKMASLYIMCENNTSNSCRIRVLKSNDDGTKLEAIAESSVDGQVVNQPIVRGRFLFVPSSVQRFTAFTISDDPEQETITRVATQKLQDVEDADMFLTAGPGGQVWLFSRSLRRFELKTDSIKVAPAITAEGLATQPVQQIGDRFYLARRPNFGQSTYLTETDSQKMNGYWRTIVGNNLLAVSPASDGLNGVNDTGSVFRITDRELSEGGFVTAPSAQLNVSDKTRLPTGAVQLSDGRMVFYAGEPEPRLWIINKAGKLDEGFPLPDIIQTKPAAIEAGIIAPLQGRLRLIGNRSGPVDDYQLPQGQGRVPPWKHLVSLDKENVVAINATGDLIKIRFNKSPTRNLGEVGRFRTKAPIDVRPAVGDQFLAIADARRNLTLLDKSGFEPRGSHELEKPATNDLWMTAPYLFVETGGRKLHCYNTAEADFPLVWTVDLETSLAGAPFISGERILLAQRNGVLKTVDVRGEPAGDDFNIGQSLKFAPIQVGSAIVVGTQDGSFLRVESILGN